MTKSASILICLLALAAAAKPAAGQEIRLQRQAARPYGAVHLRDVAHLRGLDSPIGDVVVLADAAAAGDSVTLDQLQVALRRAGVNTVPIAFGGARRCRFVSDVSTSSVPAESKVQRTRPALESNHGEAAKPATVTLGDRIRRQLLQEFGDTDGAVELEFTPFSRTIAALEVDRVVAVSSKDARQLGRRRWRVDYVRDGKDYTRYLTAAVSRRRAVVVAVRSVAAGEIVRAADVRQTELADDGSAQWMNEVGDVVGLKARRSIAAGEPIRCKDLRAPVLVRRGRSVTVRCGAVQVSAKALGAGGAGDRVEFENPKSKRRFWAVVTGPATAEMRPAAGGTL